MINIFYDVETTGTNPNRNSIHQLAGYIEKDGEILETFDFKVRPHPKAEIEEQALIIGKVTKEQILKYPPMEKVFKAFTGMLRKYIVPFEPTDKGWLIGFNSRDFDDRFLRKFFELCGSNYFNSYFWSDTIDVLCLASQYLKERRSEMPSFKLKRVAMELGIEIDKTKLHDAAFDAYLTREIYLIVTGAKEEPNEKKFFYFFHAESGAFWKKLTYSDEDLADGVVDLLNYSQWRKRLKEEGLKDGPHLIDDDLI